MAIGDQVAAFLAQMKPAMQTLGADVAGRGAGVLQRGANVLADVGDAAFRKGGRIGSVQPPLSAASNMLHAGSQNLMNMGQGGQAALGLGSLGTALLASGTAVGGIADARKKKKERMAGHNLGAQLGVQMPPAY